MRLQFVRVRAEPARDGVGALVGVRLRLVHQARGDHLRGPRVVLGEPGRGRGAVDGDPVGAAVADPADDQQAVAVTTAPTRVQAGAFWCGACSSCEAGSSARELTASAAATIASCMACCGCVPSGRAASSDSLAARDAASEASSGRVAEETPSQTIATTAGEPSGSAVEEIANASSLRWWRRPRSLTAATAPNSCSMWSRSRGCACPQFSQ